MIRDLYDSRVVACKTGTDQTVNLVLDTIHLAMKQEKKRAAAELQLHSGQGFRYTSHFTTMSAQLKTGEAPRQRRLSSL